ncbi:MAG: hypothetical protein HY290_14915 [Planctomycetia bacterium]|nr:hypothetical protein [Planctomycetia bacterium]
MRSLKLLTFFISIALLASCSRAPVADESAEKITTPTVKTGEIVVAGYEAPDEPTSEPVADDPAVATADSFREKPISPQAWARLHMVALQSGSPAWKETIEELQIVGDGFTVEHLKRVKTDKLTDEGRELLSSCLWTITERVNSEDEQTSAEMVLPRLERAAYCDLTCNPLETVLVQWTLSKLRSQVKLPHVRARLEQIARDYKPEPAASDSEQDAELMFGAMSDRVPLYVSRILREPTR